MDDDEIAAMSIKELKVHIRAAGLQFGDCFEKSELVARAKEATGALVANAPREGKDLVVALVNHASKVLNVDMAPFLEAHVDAFDQSGDQLQSGHGETFEQYDVFRAFQGQLERHFDAFVARHGFASAHECFAAIDAALAVDKEQHTKQMAEMEVQLKQLQQHWMAALQQQQAPESDVVAASAAEEETPAVAAFATPADAAAEPPPPPDAAETELEREQREIREAQERRKKARQEALQKVAEPPTVTPAADGTVPETALPSVPLMMFSQPVGLEQMLEHAMSLTEYPTFSKVMRAKAQEVAKRRAWTERAEERRSRSEAILASLDSPGPEELKAAWAQLRSRTLALIMPGEGLEDEAGSSDEEGMPPELREMMRADDEKFAVLSAQDSPPQDDGQKSDLFGLLASPFLRFLAFMPNAAMSKLKSGWLGLLAKQASAAAAAATPFCLSCHQSFVAQSGALTSLDFSRVRSDQ
jgi:hypothetical protein